MPPGLAGRVRCLPGGNRRVAHQAHKLADLQAQGFLHGRVAPLGGHQIVAQQGILLPDAVGAVLRLGVHRRRPVQLAEHHAGGPLQVQPAGRPETNAHKICPASHEALHGPVLHGGGLPPGDEPRREGMQLLLVDVHHLMVVGKEQHLFPALQQCPDKLAHIGRLGHAGGLTGPLADLLLQHGPGRGRQRAVAFPAEQLRQNGLHQPGIDLVVPVQLLHQAALGGQLLEHLLLGAPQHQPLPLQVCPQQVGLDHHGVAVAVAPLPGEALPVAQEMIVQNVDDVPDFPALIVDGRAGQADHMLAAFRQQAGGGVFLRAGMAQLLDFIEDHRPEGQGGQGFLPAAQKQVVHHIHIRLGQGVGREAADYMHPGRRAVHAKEAGDFLLPVAGQVGWGNHQGGKQPRGGQPGQRLHRFAQAHLVGQQAPVVLQKERQPLLLKGHQFPGEGSFRRGHAAGHAGCLLLAHGIGPCVSHGLVPQGEVGHLHRQGEAHHQPAQFPRRSAVGRKAGLAPLAPG